MYRNPRGVINIFSVSFLTALEKSSPWIVNLTGFFLYFSNIFWMLLFLISISIGLFLHRLQSFVGLVSDKITSCYSCLPFSPNLFKLKIVYFLFRCFNLFSTNFCYLDQQLTFFSQFFDKKPFLICYRNKFRFFFFFSEKLLTEQ